MREVLTEHRPSVVFHAAAYKHVTMMELNPVEAIRNNALATRLVARIAGELGVGTFVLVSTDKAVKPATVMGASKALAEWAVEAAAARYPATRYATVRFGNVLGSSGSVVPIFRRQIAAGGPVTVTDPRMTRYFMTIPEAVQLIIRAGSLSEGSGEVFVLEMGDPVRIIDLAETMIRLSGLEPERDIAIEIVGARPGEKFHEDLFNPYEHPQPTPVAEDPPRPARAARSGSGWSRPSPTSTCWCSKEMRRRSPNTSRSSSATDCRRVGSSARVGSVDCAPMASIPFALSVHHFINSVGADAGFAAIIGLAILVLLYFAQARETANPARAGLRVRPARCSSSRPRFVGAGPSAKRGSGETGRGGTPRRHRRRARRRGSGARVRGCRRGGARAAGRRRCAGAERGDEADPDRPLSRSSRLPTTADAPAGRPDRRWAGRPPRRPPRGANGVGHRTRVATAPAADDAAAASTGRVRRRRPRPRAATGASRPPTRAAAGAPVRTTAASHDRDVRSCDAARGRARRGRGVVVALLALHLKRRQLRAPASSIGRRATRRATAARTGPPWRSPRRRSPSPCSTAPRPPASPSGSPLGSDSAGYKQGTVGNAADQTRTATVVAYLPGHKQRRARGRQVAEARPGVRAADRLRAPRRSRARRRPRARHTVVVTVGADLANSVVRTAAPMADLLDLPDRSAKPRQQGLTHVLDRGLSVGRGRRPDRGRGRLGRPRQARLGNGARDREPRSRKLERYREHGIPVVLGGTLTELAIAQDRLERADRLAARARARAHRDLRRDDHAARTTDKLELIERLAEEFTVLSEVGSKDDTRIMAPVPLGRA